MDEPLRIEYRRQEISLLPEVQAEMDAMARRLNDPQDLEDGLFCVAMDELRARLEREWQRETLERFMDAALGVPWSPER
jgi:hypothetical protein